MMDIRRRDFRPCESVSDHIKIKAPIAIIVGGIPAIYRVILLENETICSTYSLKFAVLKRG